MRIEDRGINEEEEVFSSMLVYVWSSVDIFAPRSRPPRARFGPLVPVGCLQHPICARLNILACLHQYPCSGAFQRGGCKRGFSKSWSEACALAEEGRGDVMKEEEGAMKSGRSHGASHDIHTPLVVTPLWADPDLSEGGTLEAAGGSELDGTPENLVKMGG